MLDYKEILQDSKEYYFNFIKEKNRGIPDDIVIMKFYDLILNILNQEKFNYIYHFKKQDFDFIIKYDIDLNKVINHFYKYI